MSNYSIVRDYVLELGHEIIVNDENDEILVISDGEKGINNMVLDIGTDILVLEQMICEVAEDNPEHYKKLLQINRSLVHGAFVLDEEGKTVIFRDTLELENLDLEELEASVNALALGLIENYFDILEIAGVDSEQLKAES